MIVALKKTKQKKQITDVRETNNQWHFKANNSGYLLQ